MLTRVAEFYVLYADGKWGTESIELRGSDAQLDDEETVELARAKLDVEYRVNPDMGACIEHGFEAIGPLKELHEPEEHDDPEEAHEPAKAAARHVVEAILADLSDRQGIGDELGLLDEATKDELEATLESYVQHWLPGVIADTAACILDDVMRELQSHGVLTEAWDDLTAGKQEPVLAVLRASIRGHLEVAKPNPEPAEVTAARAPPSLDTFVVTGSHGRVVASAYTGEVLRRFPEEEREYQHILRFDIEEYRRWYGPLTDCDILAIGYWYTKDDSDHSEGYEPPQADLRRPPGRQREKRP